MDNNDSKPSVIVWADARCASQLERVLELANDDILITDIGGANDENLDNLAKKFNARRSDDLRTMLVETKAKYIFLTTTQNIELKDLLNVEQSSIILCLEPLNEDLSSLRTLQKTKSSNTNAQSDNLLARIINLPSFTSSYGFSQSYDTLDEIGKNRMIVFHAHSTNRFVSLFACLFEAWDCVLALTDLPTNISSSISGRPVPDNLKNIHGNLIAHGYTNSGDSISITATDSAAAPRRFLHILGDKAQLKVSDSGFCFSSINDDKTDSEGDLHLPPPQDMYAHLIANQWHNIEQYNGQNFDIPANAQRIAKTLACCQATLLSARTGEPEQPGKILEINK